MIHEQRTERLLIVCDCGDQDHSMVFTYYPWDKENWPFVFVEVHLSTTPFFKRIWKALAYVIKGEPMDMGHWHEILLTREEMGDIVAFLERFDENGEVA